MNKILSYLVLTILSQNVLLAMDSDEMFLNVLRTCIIEKNSPGAIHILETFPESFNLDAKNISFAVKSLFDSCSFDSIYYASQRELPDFINRRKNFDIAKKLLFSVKNKKFSERKVIKFLSALDAFLEKPEVACIIRYLWQMHELSDEDVSKILKHTDKIFFQDKELDFYNAINVAVDICDTGNFLTALIILLKTHINITETDEYPVDKSLVIEVNSFADEIAKVIHIGDCKRFNEPFRIIVYSAIKRNSIPSFISDKFITRAEKLSNFVLFTILWPRNDSDRQAFNKFWLKVAKILLKLRNLYSYSSIMLPLSKEDIQAFLNRKRHSKKFDILDSKNYRNYCESFDDSLIPSIHILNGDMARSWEAEGQLEGDEIGSYLACFAKLKIKFGKVVDYIKQFDLESDSEYDYLFATLPSIGDDIIDALGTLTYGKDSFVKKLPPSICQWQFGEIQKWARNNLNKNEHKKFLKALVYDFKVFSGADLLALFHTDLKDHPYFNESHKKTELIETSLQMLFVEGRSYFENAETMCQQEAMERLNERRRLVELVSSLMAKIKYSN